MVRRWRDGHAVPGEDLTRRAVVGYIDAGYAIALSALVVYAAALWRRRRRLERSASWPGERGPR